jgi:hypothetical protein
MRLLLSGGSIVALVSVLFLVKGQENDASEQKHLITAPLNSNRSVALEALSIERGMPYPSVITLKGNVRIKTPVCLPVGPKSADICDGYMIVRADEAEFDQKTGEIQAHGTVMITPLYHEK